MRKIHANLSTFFCRWFMQYCTYNNVCIVWEGRRVDRLFTAIVGLIMLFCLGCKIDSSTNVIEDDGEVMVSAHTNSQSKEVFKLAPKKNRDKGEIFDVAEFFNIPFYQDIESQMKRLGILSIDSKSREGVQEYHLEDEMGKTYSEMPNSREFMSFRPRTLFVDKCNLLYCITAYADGLIDGRSAMNKRAQEIIEQINNVVGYEKEPIHLGELRRHRWIWKTSDNKREPITILLTAQESSYWRDSWSFILVIVATSKEGDDKKINEERKKMLCGTGWFVTKDCVVTCNHVINGSNDINIETIDGNVFTAKVMRVDKQHDLALLKVENASHDVILPVAMQQTPISTKVFTIGYPVPDMLGSDYKYTEGTISALSGLGGNKMQYQISVPIQPGNSGGALIDEQGKVVGVVVSTINSLKAAKEVGALLQSVNYAIKSRYVVEMLEDAGVEFSQVQMLEPFADIVKNASRATVLVRSR